MGVAYEVTGDGPTVVLLHGVCHRRHAWADVVPLLARDFRVVTVDLPGHGDSEPVPEGDDALGLSVAMLDAVLDEVTPAGERPHLVGNSLGGWAALELAARGRAASVTAFSPAGFFRSRFDHSYALWVFRFLRLVARLLSPVTPLLAGLTPTRAAFMAAFCARPWRYPAERMRIDAPALVANEVIDRGLAADFGFSAPVPAEVPVTVVWGRLDLVLPVGQSRGVRALVPQAVVRRTWNGHVPMTDDPQGTAAAIRETALRAVG